MEIVTKIAPLALALIMLGLGLTLTFNDFLRVIKTPKNFTVGLISQLILLPIVAFIIIKLLNVQPELAVGVMIIAAAPGGVTSNVFTKFANGDVALSISLTAIISIISVITLPFIIFKAADILDVSFISDEISMFSIALKMFLVVTIPVFLGMIIRKFATNFIQSIESSINKISVILFVIVFLSIYYSEWENIILFLATGGLISLILNLIMMFIGYYIAKFFINGIAQQKCISLECGLQNGTLAVFVATQLSGDTISVSSPLIIPTASYALIMMITSLIFVFIAKKIN